MTGGVYHGLSGTLAPGYVPGVSQNLLQATNDIYLDEKKNIPMFLFLLLLTVVFTRKTLSEVSQKNQQGQPTLTLKCLQVSRGGFEESFGGEADKRTDRLSWTPSSIIY